MWRHNKKNSTIKLAKISQGKDSTEITREIVALYNKHLKRKKNISVWVSAFTMENDRIRQ